MFNKNVNMKVVFVYFMLAGIVLFCTNQRTDCEQSQDDNANGHTNNASGLLSHPDGSSSPFGMVHADISDTAAGFVWVKTLSSGGVWDGEKVDAKKWRTLVNKRRQEGKVEVPLVVGKTWDSDDLSRIKLMMRQFFEADSTVLFWELGIEENLKVRKKGNWTEHWKKIADKFRVVGEAKMEAGNPNIRLGYQIAELDLTPIKTFFSSEAPKYVDVLCLHPYNWPNFPTPEGWHTEWLAKVKSIMQEAGYDLPIWYTEVGATINDEKVKQMFSGDNPVKGLTREEHARFIVKLHVMAFNEGVEGIIWYNYIDRFIDSTDVEAHFGMVSHSGSHKPSYNAYANLSQCIGTKKSISSKILFGGIYLYEFSDGANTCFILWKYPNGSQIVKLEDINPGHADCSIEVKNVLGEKMDIRDSTIEVTSNPMFILTSQKVKK